MLTSHLTTYKKDSANRGMTLIEIMIVMVIVVGVIALMVPKFGRNTTKLKSTVRRISVITKQLHNAARLDQKTYRLAIQMGEKDEQKFWIESSDKAVLFQKDSTDKKTAINTNSKDTNPGSFKLDKTILKKPELLPSRLYFEDLELGSRNLVVTSGIAYIHFLPQGLVEESAIHLTDRATLHWTIAIHPLTGNADVFNSKISLQDIRSQ